MRKNPKFPKGGGLRTGGVEISQDFLQFDSPKTIFSQYLGGFLQNIFEEGGVHYFFLQRRGEGWPPPLLPMLLSETHRIFMGVGQIFLLKKYFAISHNYLSYQRSSCQIEDFFCSWRGHAPPPFMYITVILQ